MSSLDIQMPSKNLIEFMDKEFKKDNMSDMCDKINTFIDIKKKLGESLKFYSNAFDHAYATAKKAGLPEMPQEFLMTMYLNRANMEDRDYKFVLSGIDYTKKTTLYDQAKESMTKYFGSLAPDSKSYEPGTENSLMEFDIQYNRRGFKYRDLIKSA